MAIRAQRNQGTPAQRKTPKAQRKVPTKTRQMSSRRATSKVHQYLADLGFEVQQHDYTLIDHDKVGLNVSVSFTVAQAARTSLKMLKSVATLKARQKAKGVTRANLMAPQSLGLLSVVGDSTGSRVILTGTL